MNFIDLIFIYFFNLFVFFKYHLYWFNVLWYLKNLNIYLVLPATEGIPKDPYSKVQFHVKKQQQKYFLQDLNLKFLHHIILCAYKFLIYF